MLHKCFTKVRIKHGKRNNDVTGLIDRKTNLSLSLQSVSCKLMKEIITYEIQKVEDDISSISARRDAEIVKNYVKHLDSASGNFAQLGLWKLKRELCQPQCDPPTAKMDHDGTLITAPNLLKKCTLAHIDTDLEIEI